MTHYPRDGIPHLFITDAVTAQRIFAAHPSTDYAVTA
jgi:hypothetical protein